MVGDRFDDYLMMMGDGRFACGKSQVITSF